jgi:hypothetical protein
MLFRFSILSLMNTSHTTMSPFAFIACDEMSDWFS